MHHSLLCHVVGTCISCFPVKRIGRYFVDDQVPIDCDGQVVATVYRLQILTILGPIQKHVFAATNWAGIYGNILISVDQR